MVNEVGLNRGKDFEDLIKRQFLEVPETTFERMPDPTQGYLGVRNKCDFLAYHFPYAYYLECKTTHSYRLPFTNITFNQRVGMLEVCKTKGIIAGIICWFIPEGKTYFMPIQVIERMRLNGEKSVNLHKELPEEFIEIKGTKKRVFYNYDIQSFIDTCTRKKLGEKEYII